MKNNTPKLRFKEFTDEWHEKKLGEVCDYKNGGSFEDKVVENGRYSLITLNSIDINGKIKNDHKTVNQADWFLEKGDLIMVLSDVAHGNFLGLTDIIPENNKYVLNQRMGLLKKRDDGINLNFLQIYINRKQKYFKLHGQGSSQQNLSKGDILKLIIPAPIIKEQQKIADFLTAVDEKISHLETKKSQFEKYKKGAMQAIFPAKAGQVPKVRFRKPDGSNYPDWEEKKLGEICEYRNGGSFESEVVENGEYNLITLNSIDINGRIKNNHKTVDRASWFLRKDDLIMVLSDVAHGNFLGLVDIITENNKYVLNQRMGLLRKKDDNVDLKFLRTYINKNQKYFKLHGQGSSQQNLAKGDILKFKIPVPCLSEQEKIAEFLTSLNNKVDLINKELEQARLFKKSLLQQMFV